MALIFPLYLLLPFYVPPRPFHAVGPMGQLLLWERTPYSGIGAFPSFHIVWALIAASALGEGGRGKKFFWWLWAALVAQSCITTGMHSIADVLAGIVAYVLVVRMPDIWIAILRVAERIANSWQEWRIGPMRIINHGGYAAAGTVIGIWLIDTLLGPGRWWLAASFFLCSIVGAALWAQWVEGSPALLRPMGFYGGLLGALLGALPALALHINFWVALAAIAVAAPWIQAAGRLRCLVQGCCHGRAVETAPGIRYSHPRSRVCRLAGLGGVSIHATQVYSILCNVVVGAALLRLFELHSSSTLICGVYLILSGCGRFVEEAYRGEPQTLVVCRLHLYQWIAILTVVAGAVLTTVAGSPIPPVASLRLSSILLAIGCGAAAWFVTGIDFPESSRRFARLT
jgi:prolipoprotein diacylglyceryltransferase